MTPEPNGPAPHERVHDWLHDLAGFGADADYLVALGRDAYQADTAQGRLLRNAGERPLIKVATIVELLPEEFKAGYPDIEWSNTNRMRNLVAHQYDKVNDDLMLVTQRRDIPAHHTPRPVRLTCAGDLSRALDAPTRSVISGSPRRPQ